MTFIHGFFKIIKTEICIFILYIFESDIYLFY